ncbi:MAG: AraC family transcriptional regulator [Ignavibacteriaceae bacterium]
MNKYGYYIEGQVGHEEFPQKFSNQIFFSDHVTDFILEYETVYSVKYQISGTENYEIDNKRFVLSSNNYLVVNNNQKVICDSASSRKAISIFIDPATLYDVFTNCISVHEDLLENPVSDLGKLFSSTDIDTKSFGIDFFYDISKALILSQKENIKQINNINCVKISTKKELYNRMVAAKEYIIENWNNMITIDSIAKEVFMSPYHFHRIFSSTFKTTPLKFHTDVKMKRIKELLQPGGYSISDIAAMSGYSDIFSFSKAFKKYFGFAPSELYKNLPA